LAVVDAFDAITSGRPYRAARPEPEALQEIVRNRGTQFDPRVIDAFLRALGGEQVPAGGAPGGIVPCQTF
jgi:HD-GYP domain-containing protein (c-di-GMP phosphodiesterase class II)